MRIASLIIDTAASPKRTVPNQLDGRDPQMNRFSVKSGAVVIIMATVATLLIANTIDTGARRLIANAHAAYAKTDSRR